MVSTGPRLRSFTATSTCLDRSWTPSLDIQPGSKRQIICQSLSRAASKIGYEPRKETIWPPKIIRKDADWFCSMPPRRGSEEIWVTSFWRGMLYIYYIYNVWIRLDGIYGSTAGKPIICQSIGQSVNPSAKKK
jgi:hypothetical protein